MGKKLISNAGFSIIEGLIAAGVVAVSILAIGAMVGSHADISNRAQAKQELPGVGTDVLNRSRSVMLDTMNTATQYRSEALCGLLQPTEIKPGVVPINLVLAREIAKTEKWAQAFQPEWQFSGYKFDGKGNVTFSLTPKAGVNTLVDAKGIDPASLKVDVNIGIRSIDPFASKTGLFAELPSSTTSIDAKKAVFMVVVNTKYVQVADNGARTDKRSEAKELISVLDIGACDIKDAKGIKLTLSPAGTGTGDPMGRTIYNDAEFAKAGTNAFEIVMSANEVTQGVYIDDKRLAADRSKNVVAACTETVYRCPKSSGARQYRDYINVSTNINYYPINKYTKRKVTPVRVTPKMQLLDENGVDYVTTRGLSAHYSTTAASEYRAHSDNLLYLVKPDNSMDLTAPLRIGELDNRILTTLSNAQPVCRQACTVERPKHLQAVLSLTTPDLIDPDTKAFVTETGSAQMPLHCTMCFVKGCTRMGLETFGPVNEMPAEPLDAQMPECAAQETANHKVLPYADRNIASVNDGQCLAAKIEGGKLVYNVRSCSDSLPAMCFAFGEYVLARNLGSTKESYRTVQFSAAQQACREMGRESHVIETLRDGILQQGGDVTNLSRIPFANGRYTFLNLAKAGSFVAPQSDEDSQFAAKTLTARAPFAKNGGEFWVGLKTQNGAVIADIPIATLSNAADEQHLLFYSAAGVQTHSMITTTPYSLVTAPSGGDMAYVVFNSAKFRGIVPAASTQAVGLRFLCMKSDNTFFISSAGNTNFSAGGGACEAQGGLFLAPHTPMGWVQALMTVQSHMDFSSFADPIIEANRVWIAYEGLNKNPALQGQFALLAYKKSTGATLSDKYVDVHGAFVEQTQTHTERSIDPPPSTEWIPDPELKAKLPCFNATQKEIILRAEGSGCNGVEKRLYEADMKKPIYSMVWVLSKNKFSLGKKEFIKVNN